MFLSNLLASSGIEFEIQGKCSIANIEIGDVFLDSRQVVKNGLYIALEGLHTDSHVFLSDAVRHGASAAVVSRRAVSEGRTEPAKDHIPLICVDDCRSAMAHIYAAWYGHPERAMSFIGVTGTNGKTTVSRMIFEMLSGAGQHCGLIGTTGNLISGREGEVGIKSGSELANMTTPDPRELYNVLSQMRDSGVRYVVMEVTSHALALSKVAPIDFEIGVFTNLTEDHLDFHSDMESYYLAKKSLFERCHLAVVNIDGKYGRRLLSEIGCRRLACSADGRNADLNACDIRCHGEDGMEYRLASGRMRLRIKTKMLGAVNVMNTLEAAAVCNALGISPREIKESISDMSGVQGRLERLKFKEKTDFSVYIDYAHTPDALENLLRTAKMLSRKGQRIVLVFGCGGDREKQKRAMMGRIATAMADLTVITSDNPRSEEPSDIIGDIISGIGDSGQFTVIEEREQAIEYVIKNARSGDIILLAGKGHEEYYIDREGRHDFSERETVARYISRYYG